MQFSKDHEWVTVSGGVATIGITDHAQGQLGDVVFVELPEIGRTFGGKHHTTVLHSVHKIDKLRQKDPDLNRLIHSVIDSIH